MATVVQYPARSGRSSELVLLVAAILVGVGGYLSVMASHPVRTSSRSCASAPS